MYEAFDAYINYFSSEKISELGDLVEEVDFQSRLNKQSNLRTKLMDSSVYQINSGLLSTGLHIADMFKNEFDRNCGSIANQEQLISYVNAVVTRNNKLVSFILFYLHPNEVEKILANNIRNRRNGYLYHLLTTVRSIKNIVLEIKEILNLKYNEINRLVLYKEPKYLVDTRIIVNVFNAFDGLWWKDVSLKDFLTCFDEAERPTINLSKQLIRGHRQYLAFLLSCFKKDGDHNAFDESNTGSKDLINADLALAQFGFDKKSYRGLKSDAKDAFSDDETFKNQIQKLLKV